MIDLRMTADADLEFTDDLTLVSDVQEVEQAVKIQLTTREGEFFADDEMGLDQEYLLGKQYNEQYGALAITECLQKDARVTSVEDVVLSLVGRALSVTASFSVDTIVDTAEVEVQLDA